ncbi:DUF5753 domain-containing protein [Streptomyces sp. NPDC094448]|uniref:DUF5753 domain-containing protein n=1 Tax=Streptomyces sp. NPDC094448 TaxID=3366063 RepID=UPI00381C55C0
MDALDRALGAGGVLTAMEEELGRARYPGFARQCVRLETEAAELHVYDNHIVNGLLQTPEYARALFAMSRPLLDEETIEQRVAARIARQEIFPRRSRPLMSFVIEEVVLHRPVGGIEVLRGQLEQIPLVGHNRNVEVQVMLTTRVDHAGLSGPFTLIETAGQRRVVYAEAAGVSSLLTERKAVRELEAQYGTIRAQALTPSESLAYIGKLLGEV